MNHAFDPTRGLIVVRAELHGLSAQVGLNLALDTGESDDGERAPAHACGLPS